MLIALGYSSSSSSSRLAASPSMSKISSRTAPVKAQVPLHDGSYKLGQHTGGIQQFKAFPTVNQRFCRVTLHRPSWTSALPAALPRIIRLIGGFPHIGDAYHHHPDRPASTHALSSQASIWGLSTSRMWIMACRFRRIFSGNMIPISGAGRSAILLY